MEDSCRMTAKQNHRHVTELVCSQEGNTGSSRSPREMINLTAISLSSAAARSSHVHKHVIANVFSHCVKMLLGCFGYIVIFLFKIVTHFSSIGFILCRKNDDWNSVLLVQLNMYMCSINSIICGAGFLGPTLYIICNLHRHCLSIYIVEHQGWWNNTSLFSAIPFSCCCYAHRQVLLAPASPWPSSVSYAMQSPSEMCVQRFCGCVL